MQLSARYYSGIYDAVQFSVPISNGRCDDDDDESYSTAPAQRTLAEVRQRYRTEQWLVALAIPTGRYCYSTYLRQVWYLTFG